MKTLQDGGAAAAGGDQEDASISAAPQQGGAASSRCLVSSTFNIRLSKQLPTSDLEREFQGIVGYPIPWRKLGHMSLLEMVCTSLSQGFRIHLEMIQVRSMPGVVIVESLGQGHILLHAAPDKSTRHIADLVSKQFDPYRYFVY